MSYALLVAAFSMGLLGSPHCLGMCGGIVTAFSMSMGNPSRSKKFFLIASYHLGRLISYATLGLLAGFIGQTAFTKLMVQSSLPRVLLGASLVFVALLMMGLPIMKNIERLGLGLWNRLAPVRQKVFPLTSMPRAFSAGLLWGLLPCGLVYGALIVAMTGGSVISAPIMMLAFGLGTLPMLVATQSVISLLQKIIKRFSLRYASGILMLVSGIAVAASPAIMSHMHGGHHHHGMDHSMMMHHTDDCDEHDMHEHMHHHDHEHHH